VIDVGIIEDTSVLGLEAWPAREAGPKVTPAREAGAKVTPAREAGAKVRTNGG
jgi:hypothetical protein